MATPTREQAIEDLRRERARLASRIAAIDAMIGCWTRYPDSYRPNLREDLCAAGLDPDAGEGHGQPYLGTQSA